MNRMLSATLCTAPGHIITSVSGTAQEKANILQPNS